MQVIVEVVKRDKSPSNLLLKASSPSLYQQKRKITQNLTKKPSGLENDKNILNRFMKTSSTTSSRVISQQLTKQSSKQSINKYKVGTAATT
jgi:hypothetical protein